ncbi:MAG TPA: DUF2778 domain-containing protein [Mycoplana sp.]|nr:DUF2778 domain-containing protein [Mycoplana sp.]
MLSLAAGAWVVGALATVQTMAPSAPMAKQGRLQASLDLPAVVRAVPVERNIRVRKFARLSKTPADQLWPAGLTVAAIKAHHDKRMALAAARLQRERAGKAYALAGALRAQARLAATAQPLLVSALVDPGIARAETLGRPFNLVMPNEAPAATSEALPAAIPLPEARPKLLARAVEEKPDRRDSKPAARELAYASPSQVDTDDEMRQQTRPSLFGARRTRGRTAYYDIAAGVVHLPSGERLEAHSGIGKMRDNPKYVHMKMRGSTPPGTFKLSMREKPFHGVQALRMTPVDGVHPHGRTGLLTHSYLLGRDGNSHGCVAFKTYPRFLAAFKRGEIDTLVVVPSMSAGKTRFASLFGRQG